MNGVNINCGFYFFYIRFSRFALLIFFNKGLYYLRDLSVTPGLCITRCTQPTNRNEKKHHIIGLVTNHKILYCAYDGGPMRRSRCHPYGVKMSLAVVSSRTDTSRKRSRNATRCNMDHERSKLVHRYIIGKREAFLSLKTL